MKIYSEERTSENTNKQKGVNCSHIVIIILPTCNWVGLAGAIPPKNTFLVYFLSLISDHSLPIGNWNLIKMRVGPFI